MSGPVCDANASMLARIAFGQPLRRCPVCGEPIEGSSPNRRCCSNRCAVKAWKRRKS